MNTKRQLMFGSVGSPRSYKLSWKRPPQPLGGFFHAYFSNEKMVAIRVAKGLSHVEKRPAAFFRIKKELPDF